MSTEENECRGKKKKKRKSLVDVQSVLVLPVANDVFEMYFPPCGGSDVF